MIKLNSLLENIDYKDIIGNKNCLVDKPLRLDPKNTNPHALLWASDKYYDEMTKVRFGVIICSKINKDDTQPNCTYILTEHPRRAFANILKNHFIKEDPPEISNSAVIDNSVIRGTNLSIGNNVVIEKNCILGNRVTIDHNTTIKQGTVIKDDVRIGPNNVIGGIGFGFEKNEKGVNVQIPHIGNVELDTGVETGNCTTIDRAVLGSTYIGKDVKIDNLVHIAHGVQIGKNTLIIANAMIAGSVIIGENCWIAPSSSIMNKITIGDNVLVGMGAVVIKNVPDDAIILGNPAVDKKTFMAQRNFIRKNTE